MRIKQTARKSTATRDSDPVRRQFTKLLETKRNSASSIAKRESEPRLSDPDPGPSTPRPSLPAAPSRGKQITFGPRPVPEAQAVKIKPRLKAGQGVLKDILKLQKGWELQIPRSAFHRLVREITQNLHTDNGVECNVKYQAAALEALQEAAESYLIGIFEDAYLCTIHAKRVTLFTSDIELCRKLRRAI